MGGPQHAICKMTQVHGWPDEIKYYEAKAVLEAKAGWVRSGTLTKYLEHWAIPNKEEVDLQGMSCLALLRRFLPAVFALESMKFLMYLDPESEGITTALEGEELQRLQAHVEAMYSNAFEVLGVKMAESGCPESLHSQLDVQALVKICEPYTEFQRLVQECVFEPTEALGCSAAEAKDYFVLLDVPVRKTAEERWEALCKNLALSDTYLDELTKEDSESIAGSLSGESDASGSVDSGRSGVTASWRLKRTRCPTCAAEAWENGNGILVQITRQAKRAL